MPPIDPSAVANSRLADTAPALVGVAVILIVVLAFIGWVLYRVTGNNTRATEGLTSVLSEIKSDNRVARTEDHAWHVEKIKILSGLTSQLQTQDGKLDSIHAGVKDIRDRLGNDHGGHGPHNH